MFASPSRVFEMVTAAFLPYLLRCWAVRGEVCQCFGTQCCAVPTDAPEISLRGPGKGNTAAQGLRSPQHLSPSAGSLYPDPCSKLKGVTLVDRLRKAFVICGNPPHTHSSVTHSPQAQEAGPAAPL